MGSWIDWVCRLLGVHNQMAIDVATGVVAAGVILAVLAYGAHLVTSIIWFLDGRRRAPRR